MKKYLCILFFFIIIVGITILILNKADNAQSESYVAERMGSENENSAQDNNKTEEKKEEDLSEFSTRLPKDTEARDDNIKLACKTLNGTEVKSGETFSLWDILGCPTKEKGYEKAKTFTSDGEVTQSYGGGICQISTTLYNAVLEVDELEIKERHEHSREVPYIKDGKDAAVSYDNADFKFKNTLESDIKIEAKVEDKEVKIKLIKKFSE